MTVEQTLTERGDRYGEFIDHARISQNLTGIMQATPNWDDLRSIHKEALEMIQHKIARILNGDPDYVDNWHDIAGYAILVEQHLTKNHIPLGAPTMKPATWVCSHGLGPNDPTSARNVMIGDACPVCFAIHN
jgi:hypothetical protein